MECISVAHASSASSYGRSLSPANQLRWQDHAQVTFTRVTERLPLALTLLAFAQAGYVTQTHVHVPAPASKVAREKSRDRIPAPDDPQHCPFCQEYLLAGAYLFPAPVVLPLPIVTAVENFPPV